jgi:hypothetical protein
MIRCFLGVVLTAISLVAAGAYGGEPPAATSPQLPEITLKNIRWQTLPDAVEAAYVGPDQRVWYEIRVTSSFPDAATMKTVVEQEFRKESPRVFGLHPSLFESGGRVWFSNVTYLAGYDGKTWIERPAEKGHYFQIVPPNHGRMEGYSSALELGGTLFFPDQCGIHVFDGKEWTYKEMIEQRPGGREPLILVPMPDGQTVMVTGPSPKLWQWRAGAWSEVDTKPIVGEERIMRLLPWGKEDAWVVPGRGLPFLWKPGADIAAVFAKVLPRLADPQFATRQAATTELIQMGFCIQDLTTKAFEESKDPEVRMRLEKVLEALAKPEEAYLVLGPYRLRAPKVLPCDDPGVLYVVSMDIQEKGQSVGQGVVVAMPGGQCRFLKGAEFLEAWQFHYAGSSGALVLKPGSLVWAAGDYDQRQARLLDIDKAKFVDVSPEKKYGWLQCIRSDGTLFVSQLNPIQGGAVGVYRPGAPEDRKFIEAKSLQFTGYANAVIVARDGAIWAQLVDKSLCRHDGKDWQPVKDPGVGQATRWVDVGQGGEVLLRGDSGVAMIDSKGNLIGANKSLSDLASQCRDQVTAAFSTPHTAASSGLVVDKAGNIWVLDNTTLRVLAGNAWVEGGPVLAEAKGRAVSGVTGLIDGSKVYVTDGLSVHSGGKSFYGEIKDGKLVLTEAPHSSGLRFINPDLVDADGAYWLSGDEIIDVGGADRRVAQLAQRMTGKGVIEEIKDSGYPRLCDKGGNVWLGEIRGAPPYRFNVWCGGKIASSIDVPGGARAVLASDAPGSVYACTGDAILHLVTDAASSTKFTVKSTWTLRGIEGQPTLILYSRLGFFVIVSEVSSGPINRFVSIIPLPKD